MQTRTLTFDGLAHPVAVVYDPETDTVGVLVDGNTARVFVGEMSPPSAPVVIEAEPIPAPDRPVALAEETVSTGNISLDEAERAIT